MPVLIYTVYLGYHTLLVDRECFLLSKATVYKITPLEQSYEILYHDIRMFILSRNMEQGLYYGHFVFFCHK